MQLQSTETHTCWYLEEKTKATKEVTKDKQKYSVRNKWPNLPPACTVSSSKQLWNVILVQGALFKHPFLHVGGQEFP